MKQRSVQLVFLVLLLSSLSRGEAAALPAGGLPLMGSTLGALLGPVSAPRLLSEASRRGSQGREAVPAPALLIAQPGPEFALRPVTSKAWTMRPPSAHCASVHAVTGLARPLFRS